MNNTSPLSSKPTLETIYQHRSIRRYTNQPIEPSQLNAILEAGRAASSSSFMQCIHIIRITDSEKRQRIYELAAQQPYIQNCAEFLVFCMDFAKHQSIIPDAQVSWTEILLTGAIDAGIMAQNCLLTAESMNLGGVYIGALRNHIEEIATLLSLPQYTAPLFGLCLGHPDQQPLYRPRMPLDMLVSENCYTAINHDKLQQYESVISEYYQQRSGRETNWQTQMTITLTKPIRPHILPFLHQQGLAKY